uniref:Uncharacterized protein n=1 Tax=Mycena chlorophos TaxID=658473 RepID=A0ABQ0M1C8_MYCCL|nr:predicted protein [Mycena chlorophos]
MLRSNGALVLSEPMNTTPLRRYMFVSGRSQSTWNDALAKAEAVLRCVRDAAACRVDQEREDDEAGGDGGELMEELKDGDVEEEPRAFITRFPQEMEQATHTLATLLEEIPREERCEGVFGGDYLVRDIALVDLDPPLGVEVARRQRLVDADGASRTRVPSAGNEGLDVERGDLIVPT